MTHRPSCTVADKTLVLVAAPMILLVVFVGLAVLVKNQSETARDLAYHSTEVIDVSQSLLTHIAEAESAIRGFVITGDVTMRADYETSSAALLAAVAQLRSLVRDNPGQTAHADRIAQITAQRAGRFREVLRLIAAGNPRPAQEDIKGDTGPQLMAQLRTELAVFSREEERVRAERRQAADRSWKTLAWLLAAGTVVTILLTIALSLSFSRGIGRRLGLLRDNALNLAAGRALAPPLTGHDDIAELDRVFHDMAASLDEVRWREKAVIDGTTDAVFVKDLDHRYLMMNRAGADMVGQPLEGIIGRSNDELIETESAARIHLQDIEVIGSGRTITYEFSSTNRFGVRRIYLATRGPYRDRHGAVAGTIGISRDITEQVFLQLKNVELEEASRMKSEFLATMSHELRTPLNAIIGFSEVLAGGLTGQLTAQQQTFVGDIFSSGTHLLSLINDILDLSKVEAGKMTLELSTVDMSMMFAKSKAVVREKAAACGLHLDVNAGDAHVWMDVDARKVTQILHNLLFNAVKFTKNGGAVTLHGARVPRAAVGRLSGPWAGRNFPLAESAFDEFFCVSVTDSGIGMTEQGLDRLFKPFSQVDSGLARMFEGTGLGLALVKRLAELHGGTVAVESAEHEGSRFTVWLPLRAPAAAYANLPPGARPSEEPFIR